MVRELSRRHDAIIQEARLCFNWLGRHRVTECKSGNRCRMCHRKHHTSLCPGDTQPASPLLVANNVVTEQHVIKGDSTVPAVAALHTMQRNDTQRRPTQLKTAIAPLSNIREDFSADILFDKGSQRSLTTDDLARQLQLIPSKAEIISLSAFDGTSSSVKRVEVAYIHLQTDDEEPILREVIIVPTIAAPLQKHMSIDLQDLRHLQGLKLAHPKRRISSRSTF